MSCVQVTMWSVMPPRVVNGKHFFLLPTLSQSNLLLSCLNVFLRLCCFCWLLSWMCCCGVGTDGGAVAAAAGGWVVCAWFICNQLSMFFIRFQVGRAFSLYLFFFPVGDAAANVLPSTCPTPSSCSSITSRVAKCHLSQRSKKFLNTDVFVYTKADSGRLLLQIRLLMGKSSLIEAIFSWIGICV